MRPCCCLTGCCHSVQAEPNVVHVPYCDVAVQAREDTDIKVIQQAKQQREGAGKIKTGKGGKQRVEAKLDARKHRGGSRQQARLGMLDALDE